MSTRLPILLCFDVEPDDKISEGQADWAGIGPLVALLTRYRPRFEAATGQPCRFSWFLRMDPQVAELHGGRQDWVAVAFERELRILRAAGDEIGLHVHPWKRTADGWVSEFRDPSWVEHCVRSSFNAYRRAFGTRCRSFRFGDRWMDQRTMRLLNALGACFDLTTEPGQSGFPIPADMDALFLGGRPDYTDAPRHPYRPSTQDYRVAGRWLRRMRIMEIPISTAAEKDAGIGTLYLANDGATTCRQIDLLLADETTRHLALPARTDIAIRPDERQNLETILEHLLAHPQRDRLRLTTPPGV
ncbi:MAG: hypothetical protein QOF14_5549 [Hyphomicrobiales bacterium]|jgi:hypothetical protein|nr:hypothetical protein [Hyphomicrobiales bacterium]